MRSSEVKEGLLAPKRAKDGVLRFFKNLIDRRFSDAERSIDAIKEKEFNRAEFKEGYIHALEGTLLSNRSGDDRDFYNKPNMGKEDFERYRKEFLEFVKGETRSVFDEGYFSAWADLMHYLYSYEE
ncbi:MAG: hypothetical protein ACLFVP_00445 [Candidatus Bathyarchaeia archaeon]